MKFVRMEMGFKNSVWDKKEFQISVGYLEEDPKWSMTELFLKLDCKYLLAIASFSLLAGRCACVVRREVCIHGNLSAHNCLPNILGPSFIGYSVKTIPFPQFCARMEGATRARIDWKRL